MPLFAEGEAEALVNSVILERFAGVINAVSAGGASSRTPLCFEPLETAINAFLNGSTTSQYLGQHVWAVGADTVDPDYGTSTLAWRVFEFSGAVNPMNSDTTFAMQC